MLQVTPEYIVLVINPAEIVVDEDESELALPRRGYIAAKHTSRLSTISPKGGKTIVRITFIARTR